eukprot:12239033-Alexandrium_andersonii.AAC.1
MSDFARGASLPLRTRPAALTVHAAGLGSDAPTRACFERAQQRKLATRASERTAAASKHTC